MKTAFFLFGITVLVFSFASCGYESPRYKALRAQADSIRSIQRMLERGLSEYAIVFEHIDKNLDQLVRKEIARVEQVETNLKSEHNALINNNIARLNSILQRNEEEVETQRQIAQRNVARVGELQRNINEVTRQLEEERMKTVLLQTQTAEQNKIIDELNNTLKILMVELDNINAELMARAEVISNYENESLYGYFIANTRSELIRKNVLTRSGVICRTNQLFSQGVNTTDFTRINTVEITTIRLPSSVSGRVLSTHPTTSYRIVWQGNDRVLQITNPEEFWSVTRFLVIQ